MSASTTPTLRPVAASAAARFTVTDDLPTPPFPLAMAKTLVSESGLANGISGSGLPPRSLPCRALRCSSLITSSPTCTRATPSILLTAAVTSRVMVSRIGHPATVSQTSTLTAPSGPTSTSLTMPRSVIGRWISGSCTPSRARMICSVLGGEKPTEAVLMLHMLWTLRVPGRTAPDMVLTDDPRIPSPPLLPGRARQFPAVPRKGGQPRRGGYGRRRGVPGPRGCRRPRGEGGRQGQRDRGAQLPRVGLRAARGPGQRRHHGLGPPGRDRRGRGRGREPRRHRAAQGHRPGRRLLARSAAHPGGAGGGPDRKSTRLNSSHS